MLFQYFDSTFSVKDDHRIRPVRLPGYLGPGEPDAGELEVQRQGRSGFFHQPFFRGVPGNRVFRGKGIAGTNCIIITIINLSAFPFTVLAENLLL